MSKELLKRITRDDTEHGVEYYRADEVDAMLAEQPAPQPEQEPVAWGCNRYIEDDNGFQIGTDDPELSWGKYPPDDNGWWPLSLHIPPAQRKPLTREQLADCWLSVAHITHATDRQVAYARAIEAAHGIKEKNT